MQTNQRRWSGSAARTRVSCGRLSSRPSGCASGRTRLAWPPRPPPALTELIHAHGSCRKGRSTFFVFRVRRFRAGVDRYYPRGFRGGWRKRDKCAVVFRELRKWRVTKAAARDFSCKAVGRDLMLLSHPGCCTGPARGGLPCASVKAVGVLTSARGFSSIHIRGAYIICTCCTKTFFFFFSWCRRPCCVRVCVCRSHS